MTRARDPALPPPLAAGAGGRIVLRAARGSDLDALVEIETRCFASDRLSRRSFRRLLGGEHARLLVAENAAAVLGYSLVLFRNGTGLARLYSMAVLPEATGTGLGARLLAAAERAAREAGCVLVRLEVAVDNVAALSLYRRAGYRTLRTLAAYYEDGRDALRMERPLREPIAPDARYPVAPYYEQTTEFTCGPACLMMALAHFGAVDALEPVLEVRLWREATTVFMTSGLGGCEPAGMAVALAERGLRPSVRTNQPGPFLLQTVINAEKRRVMALAQRDFRARAAALDIPFRGALLARTLAPELARGALAIVLISGNRMFGKRVPHWVLAHAAADGHVLLHDPWVEREALESPHDATSLPVPYAEFDRMSRYGRDGLRATVLVDRAGADRVARADAASRIAEARCDSP